MKTVNLILAILLSVSAFSYSQTGEIAGRITDKETKMPVPEATLVLSKSGKIISKATSNKNGNYVFNKLSSGSYKIDVSCVGFMKDAKNNIVVNANKSIKINIKLQSIKHDMIIKEEDVELSIGVDNMELESYPVTTQIAYNRMGMKSMAGGTQTYDMPYVDYNTESYDVINENTFKDAINNPLSTFSVDVDKASYSNIRRFLKQNVLPNKDAVRIEEMINYFDYDYPQPKNDAPFSINMEMSSCPWNKNHDLLMIGLQGKEVDTKNIPAGNFVFLIDVSGSMNSPNKLPLLKQAFKILVDNLRPQDRVAIVVYAGAAGTVLESTSGKNKKKINGALEQLQAGGSTAGGAGIKLAYAIAKENFIRKGNNRVILATDGDFNIGASSDAEMVRLIEKKRDDGIFLTVLGLGMGNYKDSKMEKLSNAGNGNYAYIDNILEAKKVLGKEIWGTLFTIAKDVKFQIEFNPSQIKAYRLIGYENRLLNKEDFNDDKKDAGEIGSGHTVTALYEIIKSGSDEDISNVDPLKYQKNSIVKSNDLLTIKLRYKLPDGDISKLIESKVQGSDILKKSPSNNFVFSSAVAEFGMLLRDSEFKSSATYEQVIQLANQSKGEDSNGYRNEFINLVETAKLLSQ